MSEGGLEALENGEGDARALAEFCRNSEGGVTDSLAGPGSASVEKFPFAVGSEASGHHVTLGRTEAAGGGGFSPVFAGNGLKAAVNAFAAMGRPAEDQSPEDWINVVCRPFEAGHRRTRYAFYTDRPRLAPDTDVWNDIGGLLNRSCESRWGNKYRARRLRISEDPGMLYLALDGPDEIQRAGVFVRNSGTEERTGVTVQGGVEDREALDAVAAEALKALLLALKREGHPYREAETILLRRLVEGGLTEEEAGAGLGGEVEPSRLIKEMERQGLIRQEAGALSATDLGRWYIGEISG
jgi:hypothetical protein